MVKYSVVYCYLKTHDNGAELRHSLRSLKYLTDFNGEVFVIGDKEDWFNNITHIPSNKSRRSPYEDVELKILTAINDERVPDDFILMQDDIFFTKKQKYRTLYDGELPTGLPGIHKRGLERSRELLTSLGKTTRNYDIHVPILINKKKRLEVHELIRGSLQGVPYQWRSIYGNLFLRGKQYEDKKTRTAELLKGDIISTLYYTDELAKLYPEPSQYEKDKGVTS